MNVLHLPTNKLQALFRLTASGMSNSLSGKKQYARRSWIARSLVRKWFKQTRRHGRAFSQLRCATRAARFVGDRACRNSRTRWRRLDGAQALPSFLQTGD
jgi:hypothetical protein